MADDAGDTPAERARKAAEMAELMADLGDDRREQLAVPDAPPEHVLENDPRSQAPSRMEARRLQIIKEAQEGKDPHAADRAAWYPPDAINHDRDLFTGQGHRDREVIQPRSFGNQAQSGRGGHAGGPPQTSAATRRTVPPASARAPRPPSPRSFGTVRITSGQVTTSRSILPAAGARRVTANSPKMHPSADLEAAREFQSHLASTGSLRRGPRAVARPSAPRRTVPATSSPKPVAQKPLPQDPPQVPTSAQRPPQMRSAASQPSSSLAAAQRAAAMLRSSNAATLASLTPTPPHQQADRPASAAAPHSSTPTLAPRAPATTVAPTKAPAKKSPASIPSSIASSSNTITVASNAHNAIAMLRLSGQNFTIVDPEALPSSDPSNMQSPRINAAMSSKSENNPSSAPQEQSRASLHPALPHQATAQAASPKGMSAQAATRPAEATGLAAFLPQLHPSGAAARLLNSVGLTSTRPRKLPERLTPPSFPSSTHSYLSSPETDFFPLSQDQTPQPSDSPAARASPSPSRPLTTAPQSNTANMALSASRWADEGTSAHTNGNSWPAQVPRAAVTAAHVPAQPDSSSSERVPRRRNRAAAAVTIAGPSSPSTPRAFSEDVVMGGTAAPSEATPSTPSADVANALPSAADAQFTFSVPVSVRPKPPSTQMPGSMPTFSTPTTRATIVPTLPITARGNDSTMHEMRVAQADMYASSLTLESATRRNEYYTRFPDRLHYLEDARARLIARGQPTDLDAEQQRMAKKEEAEVDTTVGKKETETASPATPSTVSRANNVPPHLRNGGASPASTTPPHLRRAAPSVASPAPMSAAPSNTTPQTIKQEAQDSSDVSQPHSRSSTSTNTTNISVPTPAQQARAARIAAAIATANAANFRPGTVSMMFVNTDGGFLGSRTIAVDAPVQASVHIASRHAEYNPMELADAMAGVAALMRLQIDGVTLKRREDGSSWEESEQA